MVTQKQTIAAKRNIKKARAAAQRQRTISSTRRNSPTVLDELEHEEEEEAQG